MTIQPLLRIRKLSKRFGRQLVLRNINLEIGIGEKIFLLGANGAGKTTLLEIIAGLQRPSEGEVHILGEKVTLGNIAALANMQYISHETFSYRALSGYENLKFTWDVAVKYTESEADSAVESRREGTRSSFWIRKALDKVGLAKDGHKSFHHYSLGMKHRLAMARIFTKLPPLVLLDEPRAGLDRNGMKLLDALLEKQALESTIFEITHDFHYIEDALQKKSCRVIFLEDGRVAEDIPSCPRETLAEIRIRLEKN